MIQSFILAMSRLSLLAYQLFQVWLGQLYVFLGLLSFFTQVIKGNFSGYFFKDFKEIIESTFFMLALRSNSFYFSIYFCRCFSFSFYFQMLCVSLTDFMLAQLELESLVVGLTCFSCSLSQFLASTKLRWLLALALMSDWVWQLLFSLNFSEEMLLQRLDRLKLTLALSCTLSLEMSLFQEGWLLSLSDRLQSSSTICLQVCSSSTVSSNFYSFLICLSFSLRTKLKSSRSSLCYLLKSQISCSLRVYLSLRLEYLFLKISTSSLRLLQFFSMDCNSSSLFLFCRQSQASLSSCNLIFFLSNSIFSSSFFSVSWSTSSFLTMFSKFSSFFFSQSSSTLPFSYSSLNLLYSSSFMGQNQCLMRVLLLLNFMVVFLRPSFQSYFQSRSIFRFQIYWTYYRSKTSFGSSFRIGLFWMNLARLAQIRVLRVSSQFSKLWEMVAIMMVLVLPPSDY